MINTPRRVLGLLGVALLVPALSGCTATVSQADVESQVATIVRDHTGNEVDSISCQGDLKGEVGATVPCDLTVGGVSAPIEVTVIEIADKVATVDYRVSGRPVVSQAQVEKQITETLAAQDEALRPDSVSCPKDLIGERLASIECTVTTGETTQQAVVTVSDVFDMQVSMGIELK